MEAPKICGGCSKPIEEGDFLEIDQGAFHAECFTCDGCKRNLAGESFIPVENKVCCEACYYDKHAPKCKGCTKPIKTTTFLKIGEDSFHRDCFVCVKCKALFKTMTYFKSPEGMLCESCFKGSLKTCAGCKEPIKEKLYSAFDKYWHDKCFRCGVCYKSFENLSFVPFKGKGYHLECYQKNMIKTCKVCNKICNEDYFEAKNGDAVHEGACLDKYKADADKLKSAADAIHAKWADRLKAEANEFTFVPKGEENTLGEPRASIGGDQKTYPYEQLIKAPFPPGVDMTKRETYLTEEEFEKRLGMTKEAFYEKKKWRQDEIKKKVSLF